ncbi:MAG: DUF1080 domain-containing protein [Planctomycetes bacterium]|nr:DUF1080 domain-containing protein [Planctomycetota bacterium]
MAMKWTGVVAGVLLFAGAAFAGEEEGWVGLFDGKSLNGWKASEKAASFSVRDGMVCVEDGRSHLYYDGDVAKHSFRNFELKLDVMTKAGGNSGVYFHTEFLPTGWPAKGFECQVNQTHPDPKKTGSLYNIKNVMNVSPVKDDEWWTYHIIVKGMQVTIKVNDKVVTEHTFPDDAKRKPSSGTFCLQAHDPKSKVYYKNIRVKPLPD